MENLAILQYIFKNKDTSYFFNIDTVSYGNVIKKFNVYIYYKNKMICINEIINNISRFTLSKNNNLIIRGGGMDMKFKLLTEFLDDLSKKLKELNLIELTTLKHGYQCKSSNFYNDI